MHMDSVSYMYETCVYMEHTYVYTCKWICVYVCVYVYMLSYSIGSVSLRILADTVGKVQH